MAKVQYDPYEEDSWNAWDWIVTAHLNRMSKDDLNAFIPSPAEIDRRKDMLLWLQCRGFSNRFISAVMRFDHPGIDLVRRMVAKHGITETIHRLEPWLPETEYDNEP